MQYKKTHRRAALVTAAVSAALALTACQPGDGPGAAGAASAAPSVAPSGAPSAGAASSGVPDSAASKPSGSGASAAPVAGASRAVTPSAGTAKACTPTDLNAAVYQAVHRPVGTGTGAAIVEFTNVSKQPCVVQGHPTVAGAGNGSPQHNAPLSVTRSGSASPVRLAPGGKAWTKLTFVQVQGEADGYCVSGSTPVVYPTLVVGLPRAGQHQVAMSDGQFAECDNKVTVTAVSAVKPS
ncbi:DUF4232 domain-containing protein [Streptomyces glomeratus]|uniref:DUF4232 domain-containing protein n=1 Tax=Streptomyces glomeratus TaxID=284452 RepID=A0ABP6LVN1_9ACTN|nr:DUF4232 domain-containing protein [Streptomyces glomeratus]MCF1510068.1 DUF4232 domain-containing protein [Streptomyces glomeratus]